MTAASHRTVRAVPVGLRLDDVPTDVIDAAVDCLLDTVAVGVAGADDEAVRLVDAVAGEPGDCVTFGGRLRGARAAALFNGTAAHVLDFDDWLPAAGIHPSAPLLPAVLAAADLEIAAGAEISGEQLLAAFVAGFETEARLGAAVAPRHYEAGHHPTATIGVFGAAAGAAHLFGLTPPRVDAALSLAATSAAGLRAMFGTMAKPLHTGRAAEAGLLAARLAANGFTAGADAVTGPRGFAETHGIHVDHEVLALPVEERWFLREVQFKQHASCFGTHAAVDAMLGLRDTIRDTEVTRIELRVSDLLASVCAILVPQTPLEGKFSLPFAVALALVRGRCGVRDFSADSVAEPHLRSIADRIQLRYDSTLPAQCTTVRVHLADGRELTAAADSAVLPPPGARGEAVRRKFDDLVGSARGHDRAATLRGTVVDLSTGRSNHRALRRALSIHQQGDQQ